MARRSAAHPKGEPANAVARAAQEAARALTKRTSYDAQCVSHIETGLRELFTTYRDTANPDLPHGLRITQLDVILEYGVNHQDPATMLDQNDKLNLAAKALAHGVLHIAVNGAEPVDMNLSVLISPSGNNKDTLLTMILGNRSDEIGLSPITFVLILDNKNPEKFPLIHEAVGGYLNTILQEDNFSLTQFISLTIQDLVVKKRSPALITQAKLAA